LLATERQRKSNRQTVIAATNIPPTNDSESAILADLPPGLYTVVVAGKAAGGGGLIEIYKLR
jgi:hypothetical protein